ncbi:MAG TPA: hypothetical protein VFS66_01850 [Acidimicrobiia bacterium]|nr:hypothetical protein [Acidimicrobiia bacterium]
MSTTSPHIGTLGEGPLHAGLKHWYAQTGDQVESAVDGYVIDLVRGDLLIEIQTRSFASMKRKVSALLESGRRVRIVHPIAVDRSIVKVGDDGEVLGRRLSPRHGRVVDICAELVSFPQLMVHPGLEIEVVLTREEELRRFQEGQAWRRKGWVVVERHLVEVVGSELLDSPTALLSLLPADLPERFITADIAHGLRCTNRLAQQLAYCVRKSGAIEVVGKRGRSVEYRIG